MKRDRRVNTAISYTVNEGTIIGIYPAPTNASPKQVHTKWWSPEQRAEIELTLTEEEFLEIVSRVPELLISYKII